MKQIKNMNGYQLVELELSDIRKGLLKGFRRDQVVEKAWRKQEGSSQLALVDCPFEEHWDEELLDEIVEEDLKRNLEHQGTVQLLFDGDRVIGFSSLGDQRFGKEMDYAQLIQLHISVEYRNRGIGRLLFQEIGEVARAKGIRKLFISAHSSLESHGFYQARGCVPAVEINQRLADYEPYDIQMEFVL